MPAESFRLGPGRTRGLYFVFIACLFWVSESNYRRAWFGSCPDAAAFVAQQTDIRSTPGLPRFLKRFLERRVQSQSLHKQLAESRDLGERVELWLDLARQRGDFRRARIYRRIVREAGTRPESIPAYAFLLDSGRMPFESFFQVIREVPLEERLPFYELGWAHLQRHRHPKEDRFLRDLASDGILTPALEGAYLRLQSIAYRQGEEALADRCAILAKKCRNLRQGKGRP